MYQFLILLFTTIVAMAPVCASLEDLRVPFSRNDNFVYDYKTALVYNDQPGREFDKGVEQVAQVINRDLGQSMFFNTEFLSNAQRVRQYHIKKKPNKANIGSLKWVNTLDGEQLGATYFDRGSDTLLVVGGGFTNFREQMSPFIDMFPDYDIVLMDFRGHGIYPEKCILNPVQRLFGIRPGVVTFGVQEHRDVLAVVEGFRRAKRASGSGNGYAKVYGLGVCYSAFIFTKTASLVEGMRSSDDEVAQLPVKLQTEIKQLRAEYAGYQEVLNHGLFDKLVLDGCWLSLPLYVEKVRDDLATLDNPQSGGLADHWLLSSNLAKSVAEFLAANIIGLQHNSAICLLDYVDALKKTPLLFFFGKDDYMIRRYEFETLYNAIPTAEKTVILTSHEHVRNHLKQKELYKLACDLFFQLPQDHFIACLSSPDKVIQYSVQQFLSACEQVTGRGSGVGSAQDRAAQELVWPLVMADA